MKRESGILMHISSLFGNYSSGSFGDEARYFIDFLAESGFSVWQVLPFCMPDDCNSPYKSYSSFGANPYFIDLDALVKEGLLEQAEIAECYWCDAADQVKYDAVYHYRFPLLKKAYERSSHKETEAYLEFLKEQEKLRDGD